MARDVKSLFNVRWLVLGSLAATLGGAGCDGVDIPEGAESADGAKSQEPCDPLAGVTKAFEGTLDIALQGETLRLFTVEHEIRRRAFVQSGSKWIEWKVSGAGLSGGKGSDREIFLTLLNKDKKQAVLGYEVKNDELVFAGYAETEKDHEGKEELKEDPAFESLTAIPDFSLPPVADLQTLGLRKELQFFAKFDTDKYIVVVRADEGEPGLYVGTSKALDGAQKIRIRRFKDGGTLNFDFEYQGKPGFLDLPRRPWPDEDPSSQKPPSLKLDGKTVELSDVHRDSVSESLIEGLTFRQCARAHAGKS